MPIHKEGSGYQWGHHGAVYRGKGAREKAAKQAAAAHANGFKGDSVRERLECGEYVSGRDMAAAVRKKR